LGLDAKVAKDAKIGKLKKIETVAGLDAKVAKDAKIGKL